MKFKKDKKTIIILIIVLVLLIVVNIIINSTDKEELPDEELLAQKENEEIISNLSEEGETDRVKQYLSNFIENIEQKNWSKAYEMLYDDFKKNYFSTQSHFEEYCEKYFPSIMEIKTNNIERINNIYVLETTINDLVNGNKNSGKIGLYFVIQENNLNDFDLSFSVNSAIESKNN